MLNYLPKGIQTYMSGTTPSRYYVFSPNKMTLIVLLEAVTRSPLYSVYGGAISGAPVVRAFGACTVFMKDMLHHLDSV